MKIRLRLSCFPVTLAKFLRTSFLQNLRLLLKYAELLVSFPTSVSHYFRMSENENLKISKATLLFIVLQVNMRQTRLVNVKKPTVLVKMFSDFFTF